MATFRTRVVVSAFVLLTVQGLARADVPFLRGDVNLDGTVSITDTAPFDCLLFCAVIPELDCFDAADADDDNLIDIFDMVLLLNMLFTANAAIAAPFPEIGLDPTEDDLGCARYEMTPPQITDDVVELGHVTQFPGGRVSIPLRIQNAVDLEAFQVVVRYDPAVFTPALPQEDKSTVRQAFLEGTILDPQTGSAGFSGGYVSLVAYPSEGIFRLGCDPSLVQPVVIVPVVAPAHVLNIVGDVAADAPPGQTIELAFTEQATSFGSVRTELAPKSYNAAAARLPGTLRSGSITVAAGVRFVRGDSNLDGEINISDAIHMLSFLFLGTANLTCRAAADVDDNGANEISDSTRLLSYLFLGGPPPTMPWPACGADETRDGVDCEGFPRCSSGQ